MTPAEREHNAALQKEEMLQALLGRVFGAAEPEDVDAFLREFAEWAGAFEWRSDTDPTMRDIKQGRRAAFYWLADHLRLDLAACHQRYLKLQER